MFFFQWSCLIVCLGLKGLMLLFSTRLDSYIKDRVTLLFGCLDGSTNARAMRLVHRQCTFREHVKPLTFYK